VRPVIAPIAIRLVVFVMVTLQLTPVCSTNDRSLFSTSPTWQLICHTVMRSLGRASTSAAAPGRLFRHFITGQGRIVKCGAAIQKGERK